MLVAFHSPPKGFFKSGPPYDANELFNLVGKASHLGFRCFQIGPTSSFTDIDGNRLKNVLDKHGMERNVHVGGLYDAEKFVVSQEERSRVQRDLHLGIKLSREVSSSLVSFHPPFFKSGNVDRALMPKAKMRFLELLKEEVDYAHSFEIRMALESFCYPPFIFNGLNDFIHFVSDFSSTKLGILLEVGHLYQARFNLDEAIQTFGYRIFDVHVHDATLHEDYKKATHLPIGSGNIDFLGTINSLRRVKYDGWLTLEIHSDENKILESKELLENLLES
jgi:sugar phosphate isomerase/epimerase